MVFSIKKIERQQILLAEKFEQLNARFQMIEAWRQTKLQPSQTRFLKLLEQKLSTELLACGPAKQELLSIKMAIAKASLQVLEKALANKPASVKRIKTVKPVKMRSAG